MSWPKHLRGKTWTCDDRQLAPPGNVYATVEGFQTMVWSCFRLRLRLALSTSGDYVDESGAVVLRLIK